MKVRASNPWTSAVFKTMPDECCHYYVSLNPAAVRSHCLSPGAVLCPGRPSRPSILDAAPKAPAESWCGKRRPLSKRFVKPIAALALMYHQKAKRMRARTDTRTHAQSAYKRPGLSFHCSRSFSLGLISSNTRVSQDSCLYGFLVCGLAVHQARFDSSSVWVRASKQTSQSHAKKHIIPK